MRQAKLAAGILQPPYFKACGGRCCDLMLGGVGFGFSIESVLKTAATQGYLDRALGGLVWTRGAVLCVCACACVGRDAGNSRTQPCFGTSTAQLQRRWAVSALSASAKDVAELSAAIAACERARKWANSIALLRVADLQLVHPNTATFGAAISACEQAQRQTARALAGNRPLLCNASRSTGGATARATCD